MIIQAVANLVLAILYSLLHHSCFNTTVLSREGSSSTFALRVKVLRANYNSIDSLKTALRGQDVVVSLVAGSALGDQKTFIHAAIAAGVKRFLPLEFGSNTTDAHTRAIVPMYESKVETVNYLKRKESEISWASIVTGPFFDWTLKVGFWRFDAVNKVATLYENGTAKFSGVEDLILGAMLGPKQLGDLSLVGLWNEELNLVETDIETSVSAAFAGILVYEASISEQKLKKVCTIQENRSIDRRCLE